MHKPGSLSTTQLGLLNSARGNASRKNCFVVTGLFVKLKERNPPLLLMLRFVFQKKSNRFLRSVTRVRRG